MFLVLRKPATSYNARKDRLNKTSEIPELRNSSNKSKKNKRRKYMSFDKQRLERLSQPRKMSTPVNKPMSSERPPTLLRSPDFINNLKFQFRLPNITSKRENQKYRTTLQNIR